MFSMDSCEATFLISQPQKNSEIWLTVRHHPLHPMSPCHLRLHFISQLKE
ncbi:hypothetical protein BAE44_0008980 [Dichanthelium oligosanthes]|uniref:Uncharacterized protein n=1 Tax=Dichanthelium oligosanthes TaxID=888268 RepID=A0A1E5VY05_9POAL|nr:hypothetical protein BAE44_0008980 [Dichanthelium oligosanthes]